VKKPTVKEIRELKEQLAGKDGNGGFYAQLREEQKTDQKFRDDAFGVNIKSPYHIIRTGTAARIVDTVTDHINTSNPQVFRKPRKGITTEEERAARVAKLLNHWAILLIDEIEESLKNDNQRGEAFAQIDYNPNYDPNDDYSLPVIFTAPDPMIIYADPHEYHGIPRRVIKYCRMSVGQVEQMFPDWNNPRKREPDDKDGVEYLAYWDKDWRYIEADEEPLLSQGIQKNIFGFVPFVHCYSGFGKRSPEGKPEDRAVGKLRKLRGRLIEECEVESRLDSIIGLMANPILVLKPTDPNAEDVDEKAVELSPGRVVTLGFGWDYEIKGMDANVIQPLAFHLGQIRGALGVETPPVSMGLPSTSRATGRQEDIYVEQYGSKYEKLTNNIERMWATALGMGLRVLEIVPALLPITVRVTTTLDGKEIGKEETIDKKDIDGYYDCQVKLQAKDTGRDYMKYRLLASEGRVSWETLLIEGLGWTQDRAKQEIINALVETAWRTNPKLLDMVLREAMEEAGRSKLLRQMDEQAKQEAQAQQMLAGMPPVQPRPSEAQSPDAAGILRQVLQETPGGGARQSSAGYMQGV
jgi:hypothetical protein